ncbi:MAG: hypothetical protein Q7R85_04255 [bacterium]|nr:hypothetical protein [bacterium]
MMELQHKKVALTFGVFVGGLHVVWSALVALGWAQGLLDFITTLHFINNPVAVGPFSFGIAALLVAVTFAVGYAVGWVFASVWNKMHAQS